MEKFLDTCISSFIIEEILEDLEIIIVNDGSVDSSLEIAKKYANKYSQSIILIDKENNGHGSTINVGIDIAKGKYFKVVDADDYVEKQGFIDLIKTLKNTDADLILSNFYWRDYKSTKLSQEVKSLAPDIEYYKLYKADTILDKIFLKMHTYTIKTEILRKMNLKISENCFYVDLEYIVYPLPFINTILFTKKPVYIYNIGISTQSMSIENMKKRLLQHEKVLLNLLNYYEKYKNETVLKKALLNICSRALLSQYKIYFACGKSYKDKFIKQDKFIKENYKEIYKKTNVYFIALLRFSRYYIYDLFSFLIRLKY